MVMCTLEYPLSSFKDAFEIKIFGSYLGPLFIFECAVYVWFCS